MLLRYIFAIAADQLRGEHQSLLRSMVSNTDIQKEIRRAPTPSSTKSRLL
jgi:hypothetical protein